MTNSSPPLLTTRKVLELLLDCLTLICGGQADDPLQQGFSLEQKLRQTGPLAQLLDLGSHQGLLAPAKVGLADPVHGDNYASQLLGLSASPASAQAIRV